MKGAQTNILLTSVNWRGALVRRFGGEGAGRRVITADTDPLAAGTYFAGKHYPVPPYADRAAYAARLREIVGLEKPDAIIPNTDRDCIHLNEYREYLEGADVRLFAPRASVVGTVSDKLESSRFFSGRGIATPETRLAADVQPEITMPVIIKPRRDSGSKNVFRALRHDQIGALASVIGDAVVQPFIEGDEYSVDAVVDFDGEVAGIVPRRRLATKAGTAVKTMTIRHDRLCALTREVCRLVGPAGIYCLQFIEERGTGTMYLLEVNPRIGSGTLASIAAGFDIPDVVARICRGEKVSYPDGFFENRLTTLLYHEPLSLREGEIHD